MPAIDPDDIDKVVAPLLSVRDLMIARQNASVRRGSIRILTLPEEIEAATSALSEDERDNILRTRAKKTTPVLFQNARTKDVFTSLREAEENLDPLAPVVNRYKTVGGRIVNFEANGPYQNNLIFYILQREAAAGHNVSIEEKFWQHPPSDAEKARSALESFVNRQDVFAIPRDDKTRTYEVIRDGVALSKDEITDLFAIQGDVSGPIAKRTIGLLAERELAVQKKAIFAFSLDAGEKDDRILVEQSYALREQAIREAFKTQDAKTVNAMIQAMTEGSGLINPALLEEQRQGMLGMTKFWQQQLDEVEKAIAERGDMKSAARIKLELRRKDLRGRIESIRREAEDVQRQIQRGEMVVSNRGGRVFDINRLDLTDPEILESLRTGKALPQTAAKYYKAESIQQSRAVFESIRTKYIDALFERVKDRGITREQLEHSIPHIDIITPLSNLKPQAVQAESGIFTSEIQHTAPLFSDIEDITANLGLYGIDLSKPERSYDYVERLLAGYHEQAADKIKSSNIEGVLNAVHEMIDEARREAGPDSEETIHKLNRFAQEINDWAASGIPISESDYLSKTFMSQIAERLTKKKPNYEVPRIPLPGIRAHMKTAFLTEFTPVELARARGFKPGTPEYQAEVERMVKSMKSQKLRWDDVHRQWVVGDLDAGAFRYVWGGSDLDDLMAGRIFHLQSAIDGQQGIRIAFSRNPKDRGELSFMELDETSKIPDEAFRYYNNLIDRQEALRRSGVRFGMLEQQAARAQNVYNAHETYRRLLVGGQIPDISFEQFLQHFKNGRYRDLLLDQPATTKQFNEMVSAANVYGERGIRGIKRALKQAEPERIQSIREKAQSVRENLAEVTRDLEQERAGIFGQGVFTQEEWDPVFQRMVRHQRTLDKLNDRWLNYAYLHKDGTYRVVQNGKEVGKHAVFVPEWGAKEGERGVADELLGKPLELKLSAKESGLLADALKRGLNVSLSNQFLLGQYRNFRDVVNVVMTQAAAVIDQHPELKQTLKYTNKDGQLVDLDTLLTNEKAIDMITKDMTDARATITNAINSTSEALYKFMYDNKIKVDEVLFDQRIGTSKIAREALRNAINKINATLPEEQHIDESFFKSTDDFYKRISEMAVNRKIEMAKDTSFVGDILRGKTFSSEIQAQAHGLIEAVREGRELSPLQRLSLNPNEEANIAGLRYLHSVVSPLDEAEREQRISDIMLAAVKRQRATGHGGDIFLHNLEASPGLPTLRDFYRQALEKEMGPIRERLSAASSPRELLEAYESLGGIPGRGDIPDTIMAHPETLKAWLEKSHEILSGAEREGAPLLGSEDQLTMIQSLLKRTIEKLDPRSATKKSDVWSSYFLSTDQTKQEEALDAWERLQKAFSHRELNDLFSRANIDSIKVRHFGAEKTLDELNAKAKRLMASTDLDGADRRFMALAYHRRANEIIDSMSNLSQASRARLSSKVNFASFVTDRSRSYAPSIDIDEIFSFGDYAPFARRADARLPEVIMRKTAAERARIAATNIRTGEAFKELRSMWESNKTFKYTGYAAGAMVAVGLMRMTRDKLRGHPEVEGPPNLPGGSFYENPVPQYQSRNDIVNNINSQSSSQNGVTYTIRARGKNPERFLDQVKGITNTNVSGSIYKAQTPGYNYSDVASMYT